MMEFHSDGLMKLFMTSVSIAVHSQATPTTSVLTSSAMQVTARSSGPQWLSNLAMQVIGRFTVASPWQLGDLVIQATARCSSPWKLSNLYIASYTSDYQVYWSPVAQQSLLAQ